MQPFDFLLITLSTWLLAYGLVKLSAPFNLFGKLRTWAGEVKPGNLAELLECIYCTGFWCAVFWCIVWLTPARPIMYPFAVAGAMTMFWRFTGGSHV